MVSAREIQAVAELLQISPEGLQKAITFKVTVSLGPGVCPSRPPAPARRCSVPPLWALSPLPLLPVHPSSEPGLEGLTSDPTGIRCPVSGPLHWLFPLPGDPAQLSTSGELAVPAPGRAGASSGLPQPLALLPLPRLVLLRHVCLCLCLSHWISSPHPDQHSQAGGRSRALCFKLWPTYGRPQTSHSISIPHPTPNPWRTSWRWWPACCRSGAMFLPRRQFERRSSPP